MDNNNHSQELLMKKKTLEAWTFLLYSAGIITRSHCLRMLERISMIKK